MKMIVRELLLRALAIFKSYRLIYRARNMARGMFSTVNEGQLCLLSLLISSLLHRAEVHKLDFLVTKIAISRIRNKLLQYPQLLIKGLCGFHSSRKFKDTRKYGIYT